MRYNPSQSTEHQYEGTKDDYINAYHLALLYLLNIIEIEFDEIILASNFNPIVIFMTDTIAQYKNRSRFDCSLTGYLTAHC